MASSPARRQTSDGRATKKGSAAPKPQKSPIVGHASPQHSAGASRMAATSPPVLSAGDASARPDGPAAVDAEGDRGDTPDRLILRPQVARILGVHVSTVRRLEKTGALKPVVIDPTGTHFHSLRAVQEYAAAMKTPASPTPEDNIDGELTAQAFVLLDGGASAADLVTTLKIPSAIARKLEQEWAELRGHLIIDAQTLFKIRARRSCDDSPLLSGEDILKYMDGIEFEECHGCSRRRPPTFCTLCFHHRPQRAVEAARLEIHRAEARQEEAHRAFVERQMVEQARERQRYVKPPPAPAYSQHPRRRPVPPPHDGLRPDAAPPDAARQRSEAPTTAATGARNTADADGSGRMAVAPPARPNDGVANIASGVVDATPAPHEKTSAGAPSVAHRHGGQTRTDVREARSVSHVPARPSQSWSHDLPPGSPPLAAVGRAPRLPGSPAAESAPDHRAATDLPPQSNGDSRRSGGSNSPP